MRRSLLGLAAFVAVAILTVVSQADALTGLKAYKEVVLTIQVTPSPAPVGWMVPHGGGDPAYPQAAPPALQVASSGSFSDVPFGAPVVVAQANPPMMIAQQSAQPTPTIPVQFVAKPDPNAAFLRVIPHPPASGEYDIPYGTTVFPCAFEIYTYYTNSYNLQDWGYNTTKTGGAGSGTYPIENYPTVSWLSWAVPDLGATSKPYWNQGPGGELTWAGAVKQAQQHCIDLTFVVPSSQPSGAFTATIQYNLYVTLP